MSDAFTLQDGSKVNGSVLLVHSCSSLKDSGELSQKLDFPSDTSVVRVGVPVQKDVFNKTDPNVVIVLHAEDRTATLRVIHQLRRLSTRVPIILFAMESCETFAIEAFHAGVTRFLKGPWSDAQLSAAVKDAIKPLTFESCTGEMNPDSSSTCPLIGTSPCMCDLRNYIRQVAPSDSNVLITGETGTGKELVAQLIHDYSSRQGRAFVCLNSTAIPEALVESELFGYERGAFTGAQMPHEGKLAAANGGTAFFDEIGDTTSAVQAKLLRAIESRKIYRLGGTRSHDLDIRVLAATNQDLEIATQQNRFRSDLYYRLNVIRVEIPPLRDRIEDLPPLVDHYIRRFNSAFQKNVSGLYPRAMDLLLSYRWPGNVRELRNVLEAVFVNLPAGMDGMVDLPAPITRLLSKSVQPEFTERSMVLRALTATNWNKTEAAKSLQWSRMTLYRKMTRYRISSNNSDVTGF